MDVFDLRQRVIGDRKSFVSSFLQFRDHRIETCVAGELADGHLWPELGLGPNPSFESGGQVSSLTDAGVLDDQPVLDLPPADPSLCHPPPVHPARLGEADTMTRTTKSKAILAFEVNMADAEWLVALAAALENQRVYRMRKELRSAIGSILRVPERRQGELDCIENGEIFITFKPGSQYSRESLRDRSALLRQAVVAGCAATETFFGDKVIELVRPMLHSHRTRDHESLPARLRAMQLDLGCVLAIDHDYERKRRGLTERVVVPYVSERVSVHPDALGHVLALTGIRDPYRKIDRHLGRPLGFTNDSLRRIAERRNRIAHTGDRQGRGRAAITDNEVRTMLEELSDTVHAAERVLRLGAR